MSIINAEPVFTTAISTDTIQLGKSFSLTLSTSSSAKNLNAIDLGTLKKTFYINPTSDITFDESTGYYNRKLRLIAYQTGITHIPELKFNGQTSKPHIITVIHPIDDKTHTPIQLQANVSNYQPWLREQTLVTYNITTHFARAQIKTIPLNQPNVLTQELEVIRNQSNLQSTYRYKTGWAVFPVITGKLEITLPPIELVRDGVTTHQFYHPPISLDVKPLPLYVPATIPVGNVTFTNRSQFN